MNVYNTELIIDGKEYVFDPESESPHDTVPVPIQQAEEKTEFNERIENFALGWGNSKQMEKNTYDYGYPAILHRRLSFFPGAEVLEYTPVSPVPIGPTSFVQFWDGVESNRRLIVISPRHIYEITTAGAVASFDMGANFTLTRGMTKGVRFRNASTSVPRIYVARQSDTATDYFVTRSVTGTWALTASNRRADAIASGKDQTGANVLWIADPDANGGELRQCVADADPEISGSYGTTTYPIGEVSVRTNDLIQQNKKMLCARPDGIFTFDNVARSAPVTPGLESLLDARNGFNAKEFNGMAVIPFISGLVWVEGLEWGYCGPISSNRDARNLRQAREVAFASAGDYAYSATYDGADSYVYLGTVRTERETGSGTGPFVWHGPIARCQGVEITDMDVWTGYEKKLWLGFRDGFGAIDLYPDFSPVPSEPSGHIYMPEGVLDRSGPAIVKEIHSVDLIAPAGAPFNATNTWGVDFDFGSGWESIGVANSDVYSRKTFATEKTSRRPKMRLAYASTGTAELEAVVVNGVERALVRNHHTFRLKAEERQRKPGGAGTWRHPQTVEEDLLALRTSGWVGTIAWGGTSINGKVIDVRTVKQSKGRNIIPTRYFEVEVMELS